MSSNKIKVKVEFDYAACLLAHLSMDEIRKKSKKQIKKIIAEGIEDCAYRFIRDNEEHFRSEDEFDDIVTFLSEMSD